MQIKKLSILFSIFAVVLSCCLNLRMDAQTPKTVNSIATIIEDMEPLHEGKPHGVPETYDWVSAPRIGMGDDPDNFQAMIAWGQLYEAVEGNPAFNTRVQIKDIKAYMLSKRDNKWHLLQSSKKVDGAAYREDFAGDINKSADVRYEQDGSISAKAGDGYNYHFWCADGRVSIDANEIEGIFTTVQARLEVDDAKQQDDRNQARYLLSMSGDYWLNLTTEWDHSTTTADIAIGKFKYVTKDWQAFNMTTLSPDQISQNPPPIQ